MKLKLDGFFGNKNKNSYIDSLKIDLSNVLPKINLGKISVKEGGCFDQGTLTITMPHISSADEHEAETLAENKTHTFKF